MGKGKKLIIGIAACFICIACVIFIFFRMHNNSKLVGIDYDGLKNVTDFTSDNDSQNYWSMNGHNFAKGADGYYFMSTLGEYLMYFDKDTKELIPVCGKADCQHNDEQCNAYLGNGNHMLSCIYYYKGYIYLLKLSGGNAVLERVNPDGSGRKDVATIMPNSGTGSVYMVFHGDYAYIYDHSGHLHTEGTFTECFKKVSLTSGDVSDVCVMEGEYMAYDNARSFGDKLFYVVQKAKDNEKTGKKGLYGQGLYTYDYESGESVIISNQNIYDYYVDSEDNVLYYYVTGEGLYKADIKTMESNLIYASNDVMDMCQMSYDGKYIYLDNLRSSLYKNTSRGNVECVVLDKEGNVVNEIPCPGFLHIFFGDSEYMFASKPGEGASNGLVYIDKRNIETVKEWTRVSEEGIELIDPRTSGGR